MKLILLLVVAVVGTYAAATTKMINSKDLCGTNHDIGIEKEYRLSGNGEISAGTGTCTFTFKSTVTGDCQGLCYIFNQYSYITGDKVRLAVGTTTYDVNKTITALPMCMPDDSLTVTLTLDSSYVYNKKDPAYMFDVTVYSKCGEKGTVTNINFEDAVKALDGYHHGEDRENQEKTTYITGILLGFGLASIFLVVLCIGYCYVRNSPNRGARSGGMPKVGGFKQTMTPGQEPKEVEMGVRYKATDPDRRPEASPLLVADAKKPPVEDDDDDDDDCKKADNNTVETKTPEVTTVTETVDHSDPTPSSGADHSGGDNSGGFSSSGGVGGDSVSGYCGGGDSGGGYSGGGGGGSGGGDSGCGGGGDD